MYAKQMMEDHSLKKTGPTFCFEKFYLKNSKLPIT